MKNYISKHQKFKSICRVMNNYPQAFENKVQALAMKDGFTLESDNLSELIAKLLRPASTIHRPKQDKQQKLIVALQDHIGMGILLATHLGNMPLLDILKVYKKKLFHASAYKLYEMSVHVSEELGKLADVGIEFGLTTEKLESFGVLVTEFGEVLDNTGVLLTDRKSGWNDLSTKIVACSKIIRLKIDPFIIYNEKDFPDLFKDYMLVRGSRKRRKRIAKDDATTGEFSGTVTDNVTGLPVANATIYLVEEDTALTTDIDGYYLAEELAAGTYTLRCSAPGYKATAEINSPLLAGESLVFDFSLVPVIPAN